MLMQTIDMPILKTELAIVQLPLPIFLLVIPFCCSGFLFSATNVCQNTNQHRGVCQGSTGVVQVPSHRLPNTDYNMAERRTTS